MADLILDGGSPFTIFEETGGGPALGTSLLQDGDFELDGHLTGLGLGVYLKAIDLGTVGHRSQDAAVPNGDGLMFGRDLYSGAEWRLSFAANHGRDQAAAHNALGALAKAWLGAASRHTPGARSLLRYRIAGQTRRVYGRPRDFAPDPNALFFTGLAHATAGFQSDSALHYADTAGTLDLQMVAPSTSVITWPGVWPLTFSRGSDRQGFINNVGGDAPAPFTATINGPITDPYVKGDGWEIRFTGTLAYDQTVTVDTRANTITGGLPPGALHRTSYLDTARLKPGAAEVTFGGIDPTGTATCRLQWRPAFYGF